MNTVECRTKGHRLGIPNLDEVNFDHHYYSTVLYCTSVLETSTVLLCVLLLAFASIWASLVFPETDQWSWLPMPKLAHRVAVLDALCPKIGSDVILSFLRPAWGLDKSFISRILAQCTTCHPIVHKPVSLVPLVVVMLVNSFKWFKISNGFSV